MRIRNILIRGHKRLPDIHIDLRDASGSSHEAINIFGGNGAGKSLIATTIASAFAGAVREKGQPCHTQADLVRIDFEVDNQVIAVQSMNGHFHRHSGLASKVDVTNKKNIVLKFDKSREKLGGGSTSLGVRSVVPILSDIHLSDIRESVFLVDDMEMGLGSAEVLKFAQHYRKHIRSKKNQLILFTHDPLEGFHQMGLDDVFDCYEEAMREVSKMSG